MAPPPGPYSGTSTLALVARVSTFTVGVVYGSVKHKILKIKQEWGLSRVLIKCSSRRFQTSEA